MSSLKKTAKRILCSGSVLIAVMAIFFCSKDYNPFTDLTNAKVHVTSWSFANKDSVAVFETGTFNVVVALRENIDSFSFNAPKNRYWKDTIIRRPATETSLQGGPYLFQVSFFDTGFDTVTVTTFRSNNEILSQTFSVRVYNPLQPEPVNGIFGDTIYLSTMSVPDDNVFYHWNFAGETNVSSPLHRFSTSLSLFYPVSGKGTLWVSDRSNLIKSPVVTFSYGLRDTSKPTIRWINEGIQGKSLYSGDSVFAFKVYIADAGNAEVESCTVNQGAFDYKNRGTHVFTKIFPNLPELTKNGNPLTISVWALDNQKFNNVSQDTFKVFFNHSGVISAHTSVVFTIPISDAVSTPKRGFTIFGDAQNDNRDTLILSVRVNDKNYPKLDTIAGNGQWSWLVNLDTMINTVVVSAYGTGGGLLSSAQRTIIFNPNAVDTVKPMIWEVSTGGVLLGKDFHTDKTDLPLKIVAFDEGSGIKNIVVNNTSLIVDTNSYEWYWSYSGLGHGKEGNIVHIVATDAKDNTQERTITIYRNSMPIFDENWTMSIPEQCCMESTYTTRLVWRDGDGDPVDPHLIKWPEGMIYSPENTSLIWTPKVQPENSKDTLIIQLEDNYDIYNSYQWIFTCKSCKQSSIDFITREQDFPGVLQAGVDKLNVRLAVRTSGFSYKPHYYAARLDNGDVLLNDTASLLSWSPSTADTGYKRLIVTVGDGLRAYDTLFPALRVVPLNRYKCSLSAVFSGDTTFAGELDLFSHPAPETLFFTIHDKDDSLTESYSVSISMRSLRSVETIDKKEFFVAIGPDTTRPVDTLHVAVLDKTGSTDSLKFIIRYVRSTANTPPYFTETVGFRTEFCQDTVYNFQIKYRDYEGDVVGFKIIYAPVGMVVSNQPQGLLQLQWTPSKTALGSDSLLLQLFDQHDSSQVGRWKLPVVDCANKPPAVRFQTDTNDFPKLLQADSDQVSLQLVIAPGTGAKPFAFKGKMDNNTSLVSIDTSGKLLWKPLSADTGIRIMTISVDDHYDTRDSITPHFTVVPRNQHPCSLKFSSYSGTLLPSGLLAMFSTTQPETAQMVISDDDNPLTEQYTVTIKRRNSATVTLTLPGATRSFLVKINPYTSTTTSLLDTTIVTVKDKTNTSSTVNLIIHYPIRSPSDVLQPALSLNASTGTKYWQWGSGGYGGPGGGGISGWSDGNVTVSQTETDRQPTLVQNAINGLPAIHFDHTNHNGDDGLFDESYGHWAKSHFTVFVVFSASSLPANSRQTLVSTNTTDGFGVGIACNGNIGIFNDSYANNCVSNGWASTDLTVTAQTWYVASFKSTLGMSAAGNIRVLAWLNGKSASQPMEMVSQADPGLAIGTGATDYDGSFDGSIAAIAIYQQALSDDDRILIEKYFGNLYGITIK